MHNVHTVHPQGFYEEVATPLLTDVTMVYEGGTNLTQTNFSQYYNGSEIVVAGQITDNDIETFNPQVVAISVRQHCASAVIQKNVPYMYSHNHSFGLLTEKHKDGVFWPKGHRGVHWNSAWHPCPESVGLPHCQTASGETVSRSPHVYLITHWRHALKKSILNIGQYVHLFI